MGKQQNTPERLPAVAGYITPARDDEPIPMAHLIRRVLAVGIRGAALDLDDVPGVVWARVRDHGADGVTMPPGHVHVVVWGGSAMRVFAHLEQVASRLGVRLTCEHRPANRWVRFRGWLRFQVWRAFGRDRPARP